MITRRRFLMSFGLGLGALSLPSSIRGATGPGAEFVPTGLLDLDTQVAGLPMGQLTALCAPPAMGATGMAVGIADRCAARNHPAVYVTLEQSREVLARRRLQLAARVGEYPLRTGGLSVEERERVTQATRHLARRPLWILDEPFRSAQEIQTMLSETPVRPELIIIDHLDAMDEPDPVRAAEELRSLARHTDAAVLLLAHMPAVDESDPWPCLRAISRAVLRNADLVMALHRPAYFTGEPHRLHEAHLVVLRNRQGVSGSFPLRWDSELGTAFEYETA